MLAVLAVALLPGLYWDQALSTASEVKQAGVERLFAPPDQVAAWKTEGFDALALDPAKFVKLPAPGVEYKMDVAAATSLPWVNANGWRFARDGSQSYFYDAPWRRAALAAAEAYANGVAAVVHPDPRDLDRLGKMLAFLKSIDGPALPVMANIGIVDDGSEETAEVLNLMARRNLLFRVVPAADPKLDLNVQIGSKDFPKDEAADPFAFATLVRQKLTDEKRLLRLYGSDVVLGRLNGDASEVRVHLINYGGGKVNGLRVRVRGEYAHGTLAAFGIQDARLTDYAVSDGGTEFTIPTIDVYAVVDLKR
ncbi:MAG: hypothetical protein LAP39_01570 [Acidobacteriia bacterium]|nr:hypothetical protein [Terriglobia bacterium]